MAQKKRKSTARRTASRKKQQTKRQTSARRTGNSGNSTDAINLLKADHREVEGWFEQFERSRSDDKKQELAQKICNALTVHTIIEEEIFYPAFMEATGEKDIHHEAEVEHAGAKSLIAQIQGSGPSDDYYDAKVSVLAEMVKHHVKEEEKRDGMFSKAKQAEMDLKELGQRLQARKRELMSDNSTLERMAREAGSALQIPTGRRRSSNGARREGAARRA